LSTPSTVIRPAALPAVPRYLVEQAEHAIDRADTKAAALGAAATAILAIVAGGIPDLHSAPAYSAAEVFRTFGALGWLAGIAVLAAVILPRSSPVVASGTDLLASFRDFPADFNLDHVRALADRTASDPEVWLLNQAYVLSRIAITKYQLIRTGMLLLAVGALVGLVGLFVF
jgi:hypothetical protein